jgi:protein O-GlcNAc transferase
MFKIKQKKNTRVLKQAEHILSIGESLQKEGKLDEAITSYQKAIKLNPHLTVAYNSLGNAFQDKGQLDEAIACYQKALELNPNFTGVYYNLGDALQDKGQLDEAITCYQRAIELDPNFAYAYNNLAIALKNKGQIEEAIICCKKAIGIDPTLVNAVYNLGNAFKDKWQLDEAITCYQKALQHDPNHIGAYTNLGSVFQSRGQFDKGEMYYRHAMKIKPDDLIPNQALLMSMNYNPNYNAQTIFSEHLQFAKQHAESLYPAATFYTNDCSLTRRLRIGYVSPDFRRHSVNYFLEPVFASYNHDQFEIFCYSDVISADNVTKRIQAFVDHWRDISKVPDEKVAELIREDQIDILIDLAGHTGYNRILVFARKPAPVEVSWLGYANTTGLQTIDYRIVDNYTDPSGLTDQFYTEKLLRLPQSFLCYLHDENSPEVGELPSLKRGHITFGSFNYFSKVTPKVVDLWTRIMTAIPGSRLIMKAKSFSDRAACQYVGEMFKQGGIVKERIELISHMPSYIGHLETYKRIDIALDTFPYNGTTTTCEAMWMGVPVITLAGNSHVSRVGVSLLSNVGLPELIAGTPDEYFKITVSLANDLKKLQTLREKLRDMMTYSPLTDAKRFTLNLETCFHKIWETWCDSV